ncbi:MAG: hypothetical protein ACE5HR_04470 [bacterium]
MKRRVIFSIVLGAGVVVSFFFYGCFALKGQQRDLEIESFLPPVFLYNSEGRRDPFIPLVAKERKVVVEESMETRPQVPETRQEVEKSKPKKIVTESGYRLIGLVWDKKRVFALIQGKDGKWIVKKGDRIGEFQVFKVEAKKGEVTLIGEEKIVKLRMRR